MSGDEDFTEEPGVLVGSGEFKVDRAKALEKLLAFRAPETGPVLFLVRAASAAGASRCAVRRAGTDVSVEFDGRPFPREALLDPYAALFAEAPHPADRQLALALLHAWGPGLASLRAASGAKGERWRCEGTAFGKEALEEDAGGAGTVVELRSRRADAGFFAHPVPASAIACRPQGHFWTRFPCEFWDSGVLAGRAEPRPAGFGERLIEEPGLRAHLSLLPPPEAGGVVDLHLLGVYAGSLTLPPQAPPVVGKVDWDGLTLDAAQGGVVRTQALGELRKRLACEAWELAGQVAHELSGRAADMRSVLLRRRWHRELWRRRAARGAEAEFDAWDREGWFSQARGRPTAVEARVLEDASAALWLRALCARGLERAPEGLRRALAQAPVFLSESLEPLTLERLRAAPKKEAKAAARPRLDAKAPRVWCESAAEAKVLGRLRAKKG